MHARAAINMRRIFVSQEKDFHEGLSPNVH
jgi:hypothetical protein